jgi:hypothetical protein
MFRRIVGRHLLVAVFGLLCATPVFAETPVAADGSAPPETRHHLFHHCFAHHNGYSCGTFHSEATFVFGSCRSFFGEPCMAGPQPILLPPGYVPPPGFLPGSPGAKKPGCACP